ncbi:MAG: NosD domain-containing protein, partial [Nanoarchaeota archaeon]
MMNGFSCIFSKNTRNSIFLLFLTSFIMLSSSAVSAALEAEAEPTSALRIVYQSAPCANGTSYHTTITSAVNVAAFGDTIIVCPGTYNESVNISQSLTLESFTGASQTIIQVPSTADFAFQVDADAVTISGFTMRGGSRTRYGIYVDGNDNRFISNILSGMDEGIRLNEIQHAQVIGNTVLSPRNFSLNVIIADNSIILNNTFSQSGVDGISIMYSNNNLTIQGNLIMGGNTRWGMLLQNVQESTIIDNMVTNVEMNGINVISSNHNLFARNRFIGNHVEGSMYLLYSHENILINNTFENNTFQGLMLDHSRNNTLRGNRFNNVKWGMGLQYGFPDEGYSYESLYQDIDTTNTINGRPIYYLIDVANITLDSSTPAGFIGLINTDNVTIRNQNLSGNGFGILAFEARGLLVEKSIITNNIQSGIELLSSTGAMIQNNSILKNEIGISLSSTTRSVVQGNTISNNPVNLNMFSGGLNTFEGNVIANSSQGVNFWKTYANNITDNVFSFSGPSWQQQLISFFHSNDNLIY